MEDKNKSIKFMDNVIIDGVDLTKNEVNKLKDHIVENVPTPSSAPKKVEEKQIFSPYQKKKVLDLAEQGNTDAQMLVMLGYYAGKYGFKKNINKAKECIAKGWKLPPGSKVTVNGRRI